MLSILLSNRAGRECLLHREGPLEFGRGPGKSLPRKVIADPTVSNDQLLLEAQGTDRVLVRNLSGRVPIRLADGSHVDPGKELIARLPVRLFIGETVLDVEAGDQEEPGEGAIFNTVAAPVAPGAWGQTLMPRLGAEPAAEEMARWFESLVEIQRAAAASPDFFAQAARAAVELIGLDNGLVLLRRDEAWVPVAWHPPTSLPDGQFSKTILQIMKSERRTFYQGVRSLSASLEGVTAVVASPILDEDQKVIGAIYGARKGTDRSPEIRPLEAQLTQVLASTVAVGLARLKSEAEAARRLVQFEQFFTPSLVLELDRDPTLLEGREIEVTVLFADIRGFSGISERLAPRLTCELIRDLMELLTTTVMSFDGVVVDYTGDGLLAMWNAPVEQPDHASRACNAALAMRDGLPHFNDRWQEHLGNPLGLGVGVNSGPALVGNTGSKKKFKYGPHGHTVNLASRVEGATKQLGVSLLITGSSRALLGGSFATRRLCRARVVGISEEVDLHELHAGSVTAGWRARCDSYEQALALFELGHWSEACQALWPMLNEGPGQYDFPGLTLLGRAIECLKVRPASFDPVVELKSK